MARESKRLERSGRKIAKLAIFSAVFILALVSSAEAGRAADYSLDASKQDRAFQGTTVFLETMNPNRPCLIEMDAQGKPVWEYEIPRDIVQGAYPGRGADIEWLPEQDHFLFVMPFKGVYEVNRKKEIVWRYETPKISHDADRLPNGHTIMVWGWDSKKDAQVTEVDRNGKVVWQWFAGNQLIDKDRRHPGDLGMQGWCHTNSVTRLANGNTFISLRNFNMILEVNSAGDIVWSLRDLKNGRDLKNVHNPIFLPNGNILLSVHGPQALLQVTRDGQVINAFRREDIQLVRCQDVLPNGNLLLTDFDKIIELSPAMEVVWQVSKAKVRWDDLSERQVSGRGRRDSQMSTNLSDPREQGFYKAKRLPAK